MGGSRRNRWNRSRCIDRVAFMAAAYEVNRKQIARHVRADQTGKEDSYREIFRVLFLIVTPIIFSSFIYNINGYINGVMYSELAGRQGVNSEVVSTLYGEYSVYFLTIINIPLTLAGAAPTSMIPEVSALYAQHRRKAARRKIDEATQLSMFISIPAAVGLAVLAYPITRLLFPNTNGTAGTLLLIGAVTIILTQTQMYRMVFYRESARQICRCGMRRLHWSLMSGCLLRFFN